ncbi:MAG: DapH/DapD/GlmU-related protein [Candidatus Hodarchaeota archaeon]
MNKANISNEAEIANNVKIGYGTIVEKNAIIHDDVRIGAYCIIHSHARLEKGATIGSHCVVGHPSKLELVGTDHSFKDPKLKDVIIKDPSASIGEGSVIRSGSIVYTHTKLGKKINTGHYAIIREHISLGDNCVIGSQTILNGYTIVADRTRINTSCALPQSMRIGRGVFIAPHVSFSDNERALPGDGNQGAIIEDFVRIGIGTKILPNITIKKESLIGAGSVVTKDVPVRAIVYGVPAKIQGYVTEEEISRYIDSILKWI